VIFRLERNAKRVTYGPADTTATQSSRALLNLQYTIFTTITKYILLVVK